MKLCYDEFLWAKKTGEKQSPVIHARERVEKERGHRASLLFDDGLVYSQKLLTDFMAQV